MVNKVETETATAAATATATEVASILILETIRCSIPECVSERINRIINKGTSAINEIGIGIQVKK